MRIALLAGFPLLAFAALAAAQEPAPEAAPADATQETPSLSAPTDGSPGADAATAPAADTATPATPAAASSEVPAELDSKARAAPTALEDIVVTATKREKSVREVPATINVLNGEQLEKMGAHDIHDYLALTPGITLQDGEFGDVQSRNISIRGVGSAPMTNQAVGQFIGDIPVTDPYSNFMTPDLDPFDLRTVEILKGPQGTYFGASALNGAIRYLPNTPDLGEWNGRAYVDYLSIREGSAAPSYGAALNVPIGDTFALRGMGVLEHVPGVIDNLQRDETDADSRRKWGGRIAARWDPLDHLTVSLMYLKQQSKSKDALPVDNPDAQLTNNSHPGPSRIDSGFSIASADVRDDLGELGTVVVQASRQTKDALYDVDGGISTLGTRGIQSLRGYLNADITGTTEEVRLVSPNGGKWNWIFGAFALDYSADVTTDLYLANSAAIHQLPIPGLGQVTSPRGISAGGQHIAPLDATEKAVYGELSRRFWDDWELSAGLRYYRTHESGLIHSVGTTAPIIGDFPVEQGDQGLSPKISLVWKANAHLTSYATVSRGFQFGGVNASTSLLPADNPATGSPTPPTFKSSTLWNREIGVRTDWFDRTLRADLTYFNLDWNDAQFNQTQSNLVLVNTFVSNVGKVKSQGAEAALSWLTPVSGLALNLSGAYTSAVTQVPFTTGSNQVIASGTQMPATPRWQTAATAAYTLFLGNFVTVATLTDTYSSKAYNDIQHSRVIFDASLLNFDLSVARPDLPFAPALAVSIDNLADTRERVGYTVGTSLVNDLSYYNRPRSISLRLTAEFK